MKLLKVDWNQNLKVDWNLKLLKFEIQSWLNLKLLKFKVEIGWNQN
jgi:hypothetical protein